MPLTLTYNGNTLPNDITQQLINYAVNDLNVVPSYLITKLHYEGLWGGSAIAQSNNNWGGMTWVPSWSDPHTRASGVVVTRGSARPAIEGGHYIRYETVQDFLVDWSHLIRRGGIYNVADSATFDLAVKGMFRVGGATYDYATMNVEGSQQRYELYLAGMRARRSAINNANSLALDTIDEGDYSTDPEPDPDPEEPTDPDPEPEPEPEPPIDLGGFIGELNALIHKMLTADVFHMGSSEFYKNGYLKLTEQLGNTYKITPNKVFYDKIAEKLEGLESEIKPPEPEEPEEPEEPTDPEPTDPEPEPDETPILPMALANLYVTSEYGERNGRLHDGIDFGVGGNPTGQPVYAVMSGTVRAVHNSCDSFDSWGCGGEIGNHITIEHDTDGYTTRYIHLGQNSVPFSVGDKVKQGDQIGVMANSGSSLGIHLHFTVSTAYPLVRGSAVDGSGGTTVNPRTYINAISQVPNT